MEGLKKGKKKGNYTCTTLRKCLFLLMYNYLHSLLSIWYYKPSRDDLRCTTGYVLAIGIYSTLYVRNLNIQDLGISVGFGIKSQGHQSLTVRTQSRNGEAWKSWVPMRVLEENKTRVLCPQFIQNMKLFLEHVFILLSSVWIGVDLLQINHYCFLLLFN